MDWDDIEETTYAQYIIDCSTAKTAPAHGGVRIRDAAHAKYQRTKEALQAEWRAAHPAESAEARRQCEAWLPGCTAEMEA